MSHRLRIAVSPKLTALVVPLALVAAVSSGPAVAAKLRKPQPVPLTPTAPSADLATTIRTAPSAQVTGYQYFAVTVTNNGPDPASHLVITGGTPPRSTFYCVTGSGAACGSVPPGVTCTPPTTTAPLTCTQASLSAGTSVTIWMGFRHGFFFPGQAYCDSASATSSTPDPNTANNTAVVCARVV